MERSIKALLVVLAIIMGFVSVQAVRADDIEYLEAKGIIIEADPYLRTIVINQASDEGLIAIMAFPFHNLEIQLDGVLDPLDSDAERITIEAGDCVTIEYSEKELASGDVVNKWESLTAYCEACTEAEPCYEDADGITRQPRRNRQNRFSDGACGQRHRLGLGHEEPVPGGQARVRE